VDRGRRRAHTDGSAKLSDFAADDYCFTSPGRLIKLGAAAGRIQVILVKYMHRTVVLEFIYSARA